MDTLLHLLSGGAGNLAAYLAAHVLLCLLPALGLGFGLYRKGPVEAAPVTYETVVTGMSDGWMGLDLNNIIIDVNPAAEKIWASHVTLYTENRFDPVCLIGLISLIMPVRAKSLKCDGACVPTVVGDT